MCRSIKKLRFDDRAPTDEELYEAALQFVRKVSGYRKPSRVNEAAFETAVSDIANNTRTLLDALTAVKTPKTE
ncbi:MAG: DUF2277 domain-containing protein [Ardenticatenaceae bacterium]|nr:DUF2277 domain-containing protein [Ardenticatenaceae bacterium]